MDILSEVLKTVQLETALFYNAELSAPWSYRSPESCKLAPYINHPDGHIVVYHLLIEGRAFAMGWPNPFRPEINVRAKQIYEREGVRPMLRRLAEDAEQRHATGDFYPRSSYVARWYARLGDKEHALEWLEKSYQERDPWLPMDLAEADWASLTSDPRFQDSCVASACRSKIAR